MATPIRIKRSAVPGKVPSQGALQYGELAFNLHDAELYAVRNRSGIGSDVVRVGSGASITNVLYVTKDGNDANTGKKPGDAKLTIAGAVAVAEPGTVIKISAGTYVEENPIFLGEQVSVVGDSLREVSVVPNNPGDVFYVSSGNYVSDISFTGSQNSGAVIAFDPSRRVFTNQSPYIQNCTNFIPGSTGLRIDGSKVIGQLKSMVVDSYTQYNQGGIGVSITNNGYAQLVSIFTICNDVGIFCGGGGSCDITNSNSSFGNYGLIADGISNKSFNATLAESAVALSDTFAVDLSTTAYEIINATYDNVTGILTAYSNEPTMFFVGEEVNITGLAFTCGYDDGATEIVYPSGSSGYIFDIIDKPNVSGFVTSVSVAGVSSATRASVAGVYNDIFPQGGSGTGLKVNASVDVVGSVAVAIEDQGTGYILGESLTILDEDLGGSGAENVPLTITGIRTEYGTSCYVGVSTISHYYTSGGIMTAYVPRPYDGQIVYFDDLYYTVNKVIVGSGGTGYTTPPSVSIEPPSTIGNWGIQATAVAEIKNGSVTSVSIVSAGRGYTTTPNITISGPDVGINTATAQIELLPTYYSIADSTPISAGISTITINENLPYSVGAGVSVPFFKQSRVLATGHSFEYIGSGTDTNTALPSFGGVPIQENETDSRNGGLVVYTSTDQAGNFRIGDGVTINQLTGSITGTIYTKSLFSTMTPFILALGGD